LALLVEDVLSTWRELERIHDALPETAPERKIISEEIVAMRRLYRAITQSADESAEKLATSQVTLENAQAVLERARERLGQ
jgi:hypothetical protein